MPSNEGEASKLQKRMELLPEEALYLVERGTLFCTKGGDTLKLNVPGMEDVDGAPMTVQQAFSEMVGSEGLTLEKYQVPSFVLFLHPQRSLIIIFRFLHTSND